MSSKYISQDVIRLIESRIRKILQTQKSAIVAIDGRCASGKTTLSKLLQRRLACDLFHMDDFFLRPEQRTKERYAIPGENVDHERFLSEVLLPLKQQHRFSYTPYDCHTQTMKPMVHIEQPKPIALVEGAYACHPSLLPYYDLRIMLDIDVSQQWERLCTRNGTAGAERFRKVWIPLEETYFISIAPPERFDLYFKADAKGVLIYEQE